MATERVKVYEDRKRGGLPIWAWLLPLLLLLALLAFFLMHRSNHQGAAENPAAPVTAAPASAAASPTSEMPRLGAVHFETNQATLTSDDQTTLTQAADYMKQHPNVRLRLEGYTDATGSDPHNQTLSQRRAQSVAQFLKDKGVEGSRLTGGGFGPDNPVDTNATAAGKADNRRVELFQQQ